MLSNSLSYIKEIINMVLYGRLNYGQFKVGKSIQRC